MQKWMWQCSRCSLMNSKQWRRIIALDPCPCCSSDLCPCKGAHGSQGADPQWWSAAVFFGWKNWDLWRDEQGGGKKLLGTSITLVIHRFRTEFLRQVSEMANWNSKASLLFCQPLAHTGSLESVETDFCLAGSVCRLCLVRCCLFLFLNMLIHLHNRFCLIRAWVAPLLLCGLVNSSVEQKSNGSASVEKVRIHTQTTHISQPVGQVAKLRHHMKWVNKSWNPALHTD